MRSWRRCRRSGRIARQLARFSGLSAEFVKRCDLRPDEWRFFKELLRDRGVTVGRLDTRFLGQDKDDAGEKPEEDPAMANLIVQASSPERGVRKARLVGEVPVGAVVVRAVGQPLPDIPLAVLRLHFRARRAW